MNFLQIDRWLYNHLLFNNRIFKVKIADCVDEWGNSYGKDGDHFFVQALARSEEIPIIADSLRDYYALNPIKSFNETIGHSIGSAAGDAYFCPWDDTRIRPLSRFAYSHKVGPTPDDALVHIANRLLKVLRSIRRYGYHPGLILDGYPRVFKVVNDDGSVKYLVRDGNHRIACLSHLDYHFIYVCYEADHWHHSPLFCFFYKMFRAKAPILKKHLHVIAKNEAAQWPCVLDGLVSKEDAVKYFETTFSRCFAK